MQRNAGWTPTGISKVFANANEAQAHRGKQREEFDAGTVVTRWFEHPMNPCMNCEYK